MSNKTISFGKHKGKDYNTICCEDPTYLAWAAGKGLVEKDNVYVQWSLCTKEECEAEFWYDRMDYCNE